MRDNFLKQDQLEFELFPDETIDEFKTGILKERDQSGKLSERELVIIKMRFGIDMPNQEQFTLDQIGKIFNLTKERVRQLEARGLRKLRNNPEMQKLKHLVIGDVVDTALADSTYSKTKEVSNG